MRDIERICPGCMRETDGGAVCPHCGYDRNTPAATDRLPIGTKIKKRFYVGTSIENDGEGITYICYDAKEDKTVCLREFFPVGLSRRSSVGAVEVLPERETAFSAERAEFLALAVKLREQNSIPAVLHVTDVFDGNGTTYCIYDYFEGITLREFLLRNGGTLTWEKARPIFMTLATSLRALHDFGLVHRGISPETVLVGKDGKVRLVGFLTANARRNNTDLTPQLFPGFAAVEQYGSIGSDGPQTDIYGLAATMYRVLVGNPPVEASDRITNDTLSIPTKTAETVPEPVLEAVAGGLQVLPEDRIASMEEFYDLLASAPTEEEVKAKNAATSDKEKQKSYMFIAAMMTVLVLLIAFAVVYFFVIRPHADDPNSTASSTPVSSTASTESIVVSREPIGSLQVEDFKGKTYQALLEDAAYSNYFFVIDAKKYDDAYGSNRILSQSPAAGEIVNPDTDDGKVTVHIELSLGSYYINLPNVTGLSKDKAMLEMVKAGIPYANIRVVEKYDAAQKPEAVFDTQPAAGDRINPDALVTLVYNTYTEEPASEDTESEQP